MMRLLASAVLAVIVLLGPGVSAAERTLTLAIDNMYCDACPYIVKQSLARVPGVEKVVVSFEQKTAIVTYDDRIAAPETLTAATTQAGYPSRVNP